MIGQIARREIRHNLYSIRFPALMVISAILFTLNAILAVTEPVEETPNPRASMFKTGVYKQPGKLQFCVRDSSMDRIGHVFIFLGWQNEYRGKQRTYGQLPVKEHLTRYALPQADDMDWIFIIKIIFSLFAIIFTFDAICGERANGTLSLMCSNPVSRSSVLLGKYLGAFGTVLIPFIFGLTIDLLIISSVSGSVSLQTEHWFRLGFVVLTSLIYISLFIFLGLLVSAAVHRSSISLLSLLVIWVVIVVIHPNLSGTVAKSILKTETMYQRVYDLRGQGGMWADVKDEISKQIKSGRIKTKEEFEIVADELVSKTVKIVNNLEREHQNTLIKQCQYARRMSMISPATIYQYISEDMADAGFERQQRFLQAAEDYYYIFEDYVREKVGKISPIKDIDMWADIDGKSTRFHRTGIKSYEGDMSDFPDFNEPKPSIIDSFRSSFNNLLILFLWNFAFFALAHYTFIKRNIKI